MFRLYSLLVLLLTPLLACAEEVITVYNWEGYIALPVLKSFEAETGIRVDYHTYTSPKEIEGALSSGAAMDISVQTHNDLPRLIKSGSIQALDFNQLPNRKYLAPHLLGALKALDPGNRYAVPYLWGATGLAINTPLAEAAFGGPLPNSWSLLFDPEQSRRLASCGVSWQEGANEGLTTLLRYQGRDLMRSSTSRIKKAGKLLMELRPNLRYVSSTRYINDLRDGKLCVAMSWVGDALAAAAAGQDVRFVIPDEGATFFIDSLVIPASAKRPDLAMRFINYLLRPEIAAQITTETLYGSGTLQAKEFVDESLREQPGLYPDNQTKRRLTLLENMPQKHADVSQVVWAEFINAQAPAEASAGAAP
ncbi:MAG: extracellular solute-binding protein [Pseudomonas sp.]|uniref:extracellular solute-binding protein n=1 Tax=Pseudomonas sp. TaxID=306 RepID=UPI002732B5BE|nr:extracellular solute-binding protein [Pseudomonas sp.]MDP3848007.1 extracellular solute-binding protein [Pseudomonas sp.]